MKKLSDEKNIAFMNDPRRVAAEKELDRIVHHISVSVQSYESAYHYLSVLPPLLKQLEKAYADYDIVEATVLSELRKGE